jgi:anthranilate phosphoribosyltransferase
VNTFYVHPSDFGIPKSDPAALKGGDAAHNASIVRAVLRGERGPHRDVVLLNAGIGLFITGRVSEIPEGLAVAAKAIDSGSAEDRLERMVNSSRAEAAV